MREIITNPTNCGPNSGSKRDESVGGVTDLGGVMIVLAIEQDLAVLDLVEHFLGIATHHNTNAAPSKRSLIKVVYEVDDPTGV